MRIKTKSGLRSLPFVQKRVGELERGKSRVLCEKIKGFGWGLLLGARSCKKEAWASSAK